MQDCKEQVSSQNSWKELSHFFQTDASDDCYRRASAKEVESDLQTIDQKVRDYTHSLKEWLNQRFQDLQTDDVLKEIK